MIHGFVHPDFAPVANLLARQLRGMPGGAAAAAYHRGEKVLDVWTGERGPGQPWEADTLCLSFSTTKGVTATAVHVLHDRGELDYDAPVARYWPEFAENGKDAITVRQVLCHEAGLHVLSEGYTAEDMLDWDHMVALVSRSAPAYPPGTANGYHAITFAWTAGELVRRVSGMPFDEFIRKEIAGPLGSDGLHVGLPSDERGRLARLLRPSMQLERLAPLARRGTAVTRRLGREFDYVHYMNGLVPPGFDTVVWSPRIYDAPVPSLNGTFTARALAEMYAVLAAGGEHDGVRLMSREVLAEAIEVQNRRLDRVVGFPLQWRLGYHLAGTSRGILPRGFGHFGYGGSGGWADPDRNLSFAMVTNRVAGTPFADTRMIRLGGLAVAAADRR